MRVRLPRSRLARLVLVIVPLLLLVALVVWRGPDAGPLERAFRYVRWEWVATAVLLNLFSIVVRSEAWRTVIKQAIPPPAPRHRQVFSAFCVGLLGNAVLPGRAGEVARMAVVARHVPHGRTTWASIFGSTFAHRLFDLPPTVGLVIYVLMASRIPRWAEPGVEIVLAVGGALLLLGLVLAWWGRRNRHERLDGVSRVRRLWHMLLRGLRVFHSPGPAFAAAFFQLLGWVAQVFAVYFAFKAFQIDEPLAAAALVLLVANVALAFPLWPGSVGLFQAAVALSLVPYGVAYRHGFAYGIGLQAIEASVGIGLGLIYLAREGISFAMLKQIPRVSVEDVEEELEDVEERERKPVPGREDADRLRARHAQRSSLRH